MYHRIAPTPQVVRAAGRKLRSAAGGSNDRRGSVLIIVISLMGLLLLAGITFLMFSSQENISAEYYSDASKDYSVVSLDADALFDFGLRQLIVGPTDKQYNSALYGRRHSMLANMLGFVGDNAHFDAYPYNGQGIKLYDANNDGAIDDGAASPTNSLDPVRQNYSPAATGTTSLPASLLFPAPDTDITYPDINNLFLAYNGNGLQLATDGTGTDLPVLIPSFLRPQYLRDPASGAPIVNWYSNNSGATDTSRIVLRPHQSHKYVTGSGSVTGTSRFLTSAVTVGTRTINPFPFAVDLDADGNYGEQGVWSAPTLTTSDYEYDVDNDGDGIREGIWLDLDFPDQELPDGRRFVPLISFTVYSADGLINLTTAGNLAGAQDLNYPFGDNAPVSRSNQGVSRSEVSPWWALYADPNSTTYLAAADQDSVLKPYRIFFKVDPTVSGNAVTRTTAANIDFLWSLWGAPSFVDSAGGMFNVPNLGTFDPDAYYQGRWGEPTRLQAGVAQQAAGNPVAGSFFPLPGQSGTDDDYDGASSGRPVGKAFYDSYGILHPGWFHPVDLIGNGFAYDVSNSTGVTAAVQGPAAGGPAKWLNYLSGYMGLGSYSLNPTQYPYATYMDGGSPTGSLFGSVDTSFAGPTTDEPDEGVADPSLTSPYDSIFDVSENFALQASKNDFVTAAGTSRLQQLMPLNLRDNLKSYDISRQFTVTSFDRDQSSHGMRYTGPPSSPASGIRMWEFNYDDPSDTDANFSFPPVFVTPSGASATASAYIGIEPFRPLLRDVLKVEQNKNEHVAGGGNTELGQAVRLRLNEVLYTYVNGAPVSRPLTPHIRLTGHEDATPSITESLLVNPDASGVNSTAYYQGAVVPTDEGSQEWLARKDRQLLARDIYVLLYTLGGGNDSLSYIADNSGRALYSDAQLQEMAQFAINYVDALDPDNVISAFQYDKNLADGWGPGDDPYLQSDDTTPSAGAWGDAYGTVYGVEAQQLTFSEALAIRIPKNNSMDYKATIFSDIVDPVDMLDSRCYVFLELQNVSPLAVSLNPVSAANNGVWRLRRVDSNSDAKVTFKYHAANAIGAGNCFTIAAQDGNDKFSTGEARPSDFRVDYTQAATRSYARIVPAIADSGTPPTETTDVASFPAPAANLDVVHSSHAARHNTVPATAAPTLGFPGKLPVGSTVTVVLERRAHPGLPNITDDPSPALNRNPWIEVDRIDVTTQEFNLGSDDTTEISTQLGRLKSSQRAQPFTRNTPEQVLTTPASSIWYNTIGWYDATNKRYNSVSPPTNVWQPHFDRDFTSVFELFDVPLFAPNQVTTQLAPAGRLSGANTAAARFLQPQHVDNIPTPSDVKKDNRWYRLLEFLEAPTRTELYLRNQNVLAGPRTPGRVDLNGIRHRGVLAGLIDDGIVNPSTGAQVGGHLNVSYATGTSPTAMLIDTSETTSAGYTKTRDWWVQFLRSRDGIDPQSGYVLPGLATSRPFRNLSYIDPADSLTSNFQHASASLEHTILRSLPMDGDGAAPTSPSVLNGYGHTNNRRRLFEARTSGDWTTNAIDSHMRHRLLRKVAENSTTRSNVFFVFMSVEYFEAVKATDGSIQIGDKLSGSPGYKGFFVVDRSLPEQAFKNTGTSFDYSTFDFKQFVKYRQQIQ